MKQKIMLVASIGTLSTFFGCATIPPPSYQLNYGNQDMEEVVGNIVFILQSHNVPIDYVNEKMGVINTGWNATGVKNIYGDDFEVQYKIAVSRPPQSKILINSSVRIWVQGKYVQKNSLEENINSIVKQIPDEISSYYTVISKSQ